MKFNEVIWKFVRDEQGTESVEFGAVGLLIVGGTVKGVSDAKDLIQEKTEVMLDEIGSIN
jgi:Flp pilus assembly pilin Flp